MSITGDPRAVPGGTGADGFDCPRCGAAAVASYYGPCAACCDQLRSAFARDARQVEVEDYAPKMNVTPNAVALKDD